MRYSTKVLLTLLFPIAIALPAMSILLPVTPVEIENRRLTPPTLSLARLTQPRFYREALEYVQDANPMRVLLIRLGSGLDYWVFDDSPNPSEVFKGVDDWLFYRRTVDVACTTPPERVSSNLEEFATRIARDGPRVVVTVAPSKFVIDPERLTEDQRELTRCGIEASAELQARLGESDLEHYVDGWRILRDLKDSGVEPYFRTDTHFNYEGSIPWMKALVSEIAPVWDDGAVIDLGAKDWLGNLMSFISLALPERVQEVVVDRGLQRSPIVGTNVTTRRYRPIRHDMPVIAEKVTVIGDSFMRLPEPSLVQYFSDISFMDWGDPESVMDFIEEAPRSDVVVIEISELDIWSTFSDRHMSERYDVGR